MNKRINIEQIAAIAAHIRDVVGDDDQCFLDTLEGETDAFEALSGLVRESEEATATASALKALSDQYAARAKRIAAQAQARRGGIRAIMDAIGEKKVTLPEATLSIQPGRVSVNYTDKDAVPTQMRRPGPPDGTAIRKALDAGEVVPGAELKAGDPILTVRTS